MSGLLNREKKRDKKRKGKKYMKWKHEYKNAKVRNNIDDE